jgi:hypothetical protein
MMRRMKTFLMLSRSTPLPTYTWELQFFGYPSTQAEWRKSATRARQIWWGERGKNLRLVEKEPDIDYRFHMTFQQDFYESVIITKTKPVAIFQWINWTNMEGKHDVIFDEVVGACRAKY